MRRTRYRLRHRAQVLILALGCLISEPGERRLLLPITESQAPFESEALGHRALHFVHAFPARMRSLVIRWYSSSSRSAQSLRQTSDPLRVGGHDHDGHGRAGDSDWSRLHATAVESLAAIDLLLSFEVVRPPWVKSLTGGLDEAPTLADALAFLRESPAALAFFHWNDEEVPIEARLLDWVVGGVLPLSVTETMEYLRERLRTVRVIWIVTDPASIPTDQLRAAASGLLSFAETLASVKAMDPSLALLAGANEEGDVHRMPRPAKDDPTLIGRALDEAVDVAVWEGKTEAARRLLKEAGEFSERQIHAVADAAERETYRRLAKQAEGFTLELTHAPNIFAASTRQRAWRNASSTAYNWLKSVMGNGMIVTVPGDDVGTTRPGADFAVVATIASPEDPDVDLAPWLYGIDLSVLQPVPSENNGQTSGVSGLPIALVDLATGIRRVRRLVHDENTTPGFELGTAHFPNLMPGTYRVELFPWGSGPRHEYREPPSDGPDSSGAASRRSHPWELARQFWRRILSQLERFQLRRFAAAALACAA